MYLWNVSCFIHLEGKTGKFIARLQLLLPLSYHNMAIISYSESFYWIVGVVIPVTPVMTFSFH